VFEFRVCDAGPRPDCAGLTQHLRRSHGRGRAAESQGPSESAVRDLCAARSIQRSGARLARMVPDAEGARFQVARATIALLELTGTLITIGASVSAYCMLVLNQAGRAERAAVLAATD
jgi:hypothetical protein